MKIGKALAILCFFTIIFGSCFDPPEFPVVPKIEFEKVEFLDAADPNTDSLVIYIKFKDGDGDLGIDENDPQFLSYPFNDVLFYQENNGELDSAVIISGTYDNIRYDLLDISDPTKKLVVFSTRKKPAYSYLPAFQCSKYEILADAHDPNKPPVGRKLLIDKANKSVLPPTTKIVDSLEGNLGVFKYYQIKDTIYFTPNPNHYNIEVDFLLKNTNGTYTEFDWRQEYCSTFDGRFPILSDQPKALVGTLRYGMSSIGFNPLFGNRTMRLKIKIRDRALHESNEVDTGDFTLPAIRR